MGIMIIALLLSRWTSEKTACMRYLQGRLFILHLQYVYVCRVSQIAFWMS